MLSKQDIIDLARITQDAYPDPMTRRAIVGKMALYIAAKKGASFDAVDFIRNCGLSEVEHASEIKAICECPGCLHGRMDTFLKQCGSFAGIEFADLEQELV